MQWFNLIANSTDVLISNMDLRAEVCGKPFTVLSTFLTSIQSTNGTKIANSDGWDTYRSDRVVIQDSYIINTDGGFSGYCNLGTRLIFSRLRVFQAKQHERRHPEP